jgi:hypothetical protein
MKKQIGLFAVVLIISLASILVFEVEAEQRWKNYIIERWRFKVGRPFNWEIRDYNNTEEGLRFLLSSPREEESDIELSIELSISAKKAKPFESLEERVKYKIGIYKKRAEIKGEYFGVEEQKGILLDGVEAIEVICIKEGPETDRAKIDTVFVKNEGIDYNLEFTALAIIEWDELINQIKDSWEFI